MAYKHRFNSKERERLWQREALAAYKAGRGHFPICVHCDLPVTPEQDWDQAHVTVPRAFGGKTVGVGHRLCNQRDNNLVVTPAVAKSDRVRRRYIGAVGPGLGRRPMRAGRRDRVTKTFRHGVQPRLTLAQKHARMMAKRALFTELPEA